MGPAIVHIYNLLYGYVFGIIIAWLREIPQGPPAGSGEREKEGAKMDDLRLLVTTRDGLRECYNLGMLDKLMDDPAVYEIVDRETGEILFYD